MDHLEEILQLAEDYNRELPGRPAELEMPRGAQIASWIDHTQLKPEATAEQIRKVCLEAREHHFASVCVNSGNIPLTAKLLDGSGVRACATIGFPLGAMFESVKVYEAATCLESGATEIDMVMNVGALKGGYYEQVYTDIRAVTETVHGKGCLLKVILETALLTRKEKILACLISKEAGVDFVKTSTGFVPGGATEEDVDLMFRIVGPEIKVKASGGIRDLKTAEGMIRAGASRLGVSAGVQILHEATEAMKAVR